ncbi:NAD(P)-binding protein [Cucurbitaria berberidis CBS 394.84]|uniref:NAD(P)-binding protein n=1 Tax=Cucurbitaria berberidis CBS 394.84 TaxID=1168544 RepID=A0A9P4GES7_9PLEO|nr:NAD(P)-binding protein [Cucurbitaria berberidis CBS 394.84]KAF1844047.1 NAD(P)-binding protein [Cucurbitaria berberidis CBS 394.84]
MSTYATSILITGGTQGMGYHTALSLAKQQPSTLIVIASRTDPKNAAASINKLLDQSNVIYMPLDLSSLAKVREFATRWDTAGHPPIQALVFNAAIQFPGGIEYTQDGVEASFGVNHLGHALLFHLLVSKLTNDARVVIVSSGVHDPSLKWGLSPAYTTPEEVAYPKPEAIKGSSGRDRYATSKVANVLWTLALGRHFASQPSHNDKTVVALDPGLMFPTNLARNASWIVRFLSLNVAPRLVPLLRAVVSSNINLASESGENLAWLAVGNEVRGKKGVYFEKRGEHCVSKQAEQEELQEELWRWTIDKVAESPEEKARFAKIE